MPSSYQPLSAVAGGSFDVIVVGAGSSGCSLVARLCKERPDLSVLLLEAGPRAHKRKLVTDPVVYPAAWGTSIDWKYESEPHPGLTEPDSDGLTPRKLDMTIGKTLGELRAMHTFLPTLPDPFLSCSRRQLIDQCNDVGARCEGGLRPMGARGWCHRLGTR